jgi:putative glutamine amidotransferase
MLLSTEWRPAFTRYGGAWVRAGGSFDELLPLSPLDELPPDLECDGVLLTGGADVGPECYGERPAPGIELDTCPPRDALELAVLARADERRWPLFGICRGQQILNVQRGGTLFQDLDSAGFPGHRVDTPRDAPAHAVRRQGAARWLDLLPAEVMVNTRHHQAVRRIGRGLRAVAAAPDGVVEALEGDDADRCVMAVQWHPEDIAGGVHEALFRAFREACARRAAARGRP